MEGRETERRSNARNKMRGRKKGNEMEKEMSVSSGRVFGIFPSYALSLPPDIA